MTHRLYPAFLNSVLLAGITLAACTRGGGADTRLASADVPKDTAIIDSIPACASCSITVVDSVVLGSVNDATIPARMPHFVRDGHGRHYLVFKGWVNHPTLRYDSAGKFAGRVGASGQGPGEYELPADAFVIAGDSLVMFEMSQSYGQVYSPEGKYIRRIYDVGGERIHVRTGTDASVYAVRLSHGSVNSSPVQIMKSHESGTDTFPIFSPVMRLPAGYSAYRVVGGVKVPLEMRLNASATVAPDGSVWAYSESNYRLEQHDTRGVPRKLFGVLAPGEPAPSMTSAAVDSALAAKRIAPSRMAPQVRSTKQKHALTIRRWLDVDSAGLLWITRHIAAPSWDTIVPRGQKLSPDEAPEEVTLPRDVEDRQYHTIVEVIDPRVARLLARIELPFKGERVGAGFVGRVTANDDGFFIPSVYTLKLKREPSTLQSEKRE